jgi:hypothetical protein
MTFLFSRECAEELRSLRENGLGPRSPLGRREKASMHVQDAEFFPAPLQKGNHNQWMAASPIALEHGATVTCPSFASCPRKR